MATQATPGYSTLSDKNVEYLIDGNTLLLKVDLTQDFGPSKSSGKTNVIATTGIPRWVEVPFIGRVLIGLNVNRKP